MFLMKSFLDAKPLFFFYYVTQLKVPSLNLCGEIYGEKMKAIKEAVRRVTEATSLTLPDTCKTFLARRLSSNSEPFQRTRYQHEAPWARTTSK
jgi:hypothetical protein